MDINVLNEKTRMVTGLLRNFGEYYDESPSKYKIIADGYLFYKNDEFEVRKYLKNNNIVILYNENLVFDVSKRIYIPGEWEEVLSDYYWKIPTMLANEETAKQKILKRY